MLHDEFEPIDLKDFICLYAPGICKRWDQKEKSKQTQTQEYTPYQEDVMKDLQTAYSPYLGQGMLGGLSDLETNALNMLKGADVWGPLSTAGKGLLTGTTGAAPITPESASLAFKGSVEDPAWYNWQDKLKPEIKEAHSGPGYWGSARADAVSEGAGDVARWLGSEKSKWMWDAEQTNRAIEEAKAGRALSAMGVVPSSMLGWAGGISGIGRQAQTILNQITDPQVLNVLYSILNARPAGATTKETESTPSQFQQLGNWVGLGADAATLASGLPSFGGKTTWNQMKTEMDNPYYYS